jgi:hypothetical protein
MVRRAFLVLVTGLIPLALLAACGQGTGGRSATGPNPCAGKLVRRTYGKASGCTWVQVGSSVGVGCGDPGSSVPPELPRRLCADLPAV